MLYQPQTMWRNLLEGLIYRPMTYRHTQMYAKPSLVPMLDPEIVLNYYSIIEIRSLFVKNTK